MKNQIITIGIAFMMAVGFSSCEKDDTKPVSAGTQGTYDPMTHGKWKVATYEMNGVNHSDFYAPYTFTFKTGGVIEANGGGKSVKGTWSQNPVNGKESLQIDFKDQEPFNLLNSQNWEVITKTATDMDLIGSRGDDGTYKLRLTKN
jgi:hypothetical protein